MSCPIVGSLRYRFRPFFLAVTSYYSPSDSLGVGFGRYPKSYRALILSEHSVVNFLRVGIYAFPTKKNVLFKWVSKQGKFPLETSVKQNLARLHMKMAGNSTGRSPGHDLSRNISRQGMGRKGLKNKRRRISQWRRSVFYHFRSRGEFRPYFFSETAAQVNFPTYS